MKINKTNIVLLFLVLLFASCENAIVEPVEVNVTGYWQNTKDEIINDVNYYHYPCVIEIVQDARGLLTVVGRLTYDRETYSTLDFNGTGVALTDAGSISFSFTSNDIFFANGIPTKISGQFNGNIINDSKGMMLRGHLKINILGFMGVMHFRQTSPVNYLPKLNPHNQGGITTY